MLKDVVKSIFTGLGIALLYWMWSALSPSFSSGPAEDEALVVGTGFFLSFEMVVLAGVILSKMKKNS
jgi:formate/nitrite transporter FocA (FNT family)